MYVFLFLNMVVFFIIYCVLMFIVVVDNFISKMNKKIFSSMKKLMIEKKCMVFIELLIFDSDIGIFLKSSVSRSVLDEFVVMFKSMKGFKSMSKMKE